MSSPKRHVFISLLFIPKCFSKPFIIRSLNKSWYGNLVSSCLVLELSQLSRQSCATARDSVCIRAWIQKGDTLVSQLGLSTVHYCKAKGEFPVQLNYWLWKLNLSIVINTHRTVPNMVYNTIQQNNNMKKKTSNFFTALTMRWVPLNTKM